MENFMLAYNEEEVNKKLDEIRGQFARANKLNEQLSEENYRLRDEHFKEKELAEMGKILEQMRADYWRGFPISEEEEKKINEFQKEHDTNFHSNPTQYHGVSGGGYEYVFYPTGLGTIGYCICSECKSRAIKEMGANWWSKMKEWGSFVEFGDFG